MNRHPWPCNFSIARLMFFGAVLFMTTCLQAADERTATVGMQAQIKQLVLPGTRLEPKPLVDRLAPIVVRVTGAFAHGDSFRYDLTYYGLEPGEFDLADALQRVDGSSSDDLPEIKVSITPVLPPGQVEPNALQSAAAPYLGGYRTLWIVGGAIWLVGLFAILFVGRKRTDFGSETDAKPQTLADRLRPTVEQAIAGELDSERLAELERMLVAYWRRRLNLVDASAADAMNRLREHDEAGALLKQLEIWLHRPDGGESVDVAELLKPYQNLPPEAID